MALWLDRLLKQPSPEQLITSQLRTLISLQLETNLLLRESLLTMGRTPQTPPTILYGEGVAPMASRPALPPTHRIRTANDVSNTNLPQPTPTPSVETATDLESPDA